MDCNSDKTSDSIDIDRYQRVLDVLDQAVVELDEHGKTVNVNKASEVILGIKPGFIKGRRLIDLIGPRLVPTASFPPLSASLNESLYPMSAEAVYDHPCGRRRLLRWSVWTESTNDQARNVIVMFTDLSEQQDSEDKFSDVVEDFLSVMQHRLQTSVLANMRVNELLLEGAFGPLNDKQAEILRAAQDNDRDMARVLKILLDLYRYKKRRPQLELERCLATGLLSEMIAEFTKRCQLMGIKLSIHVVEPLPEIEVDRKEIGKIFRHLSENALKHARASITITARLAQNRLHIAFEDDGKGLDPEDIPNLFTRFFQVTAQGRYAPVTGAGLCLCSEIARAHGGSLSCRSRLNHGACFTLSLPVAEMNHLQG